MIQVILLIVVDQPALESVLQTCPHGVVSAVPQHKALIFRIRPVREQRCREGLGPVLALCPELKALLGHIEGEVAHQREAAVLIHQEVASIVIEFHMNLILHAGILDLPVNRILEGQLARLLDHIVAGYQHAGLLVPQIVRIRYHRNKRQGVIRVDKESPRQCVAGSDFPGGEGLGPQHRRKVQLQLFSVIGVGVLGRR